MILSLGLLVDDAIIIIETIVVKMEGAPRFYLAISPELPDPSFAKIVVLTPDEKARETLKRRVRQAAADGLAPEARIRATQIVFGPYSPFPVAFRVMGPEQARVRAIAERVRAVMLKNGGMRQVNTDWGERVPAVHFVLDQDRLRAIGLSSQDASQQLQFLLTGVPVTQVRELASTCRRIRYPDLPGTALAPASRQHRKLATVPTIRSAGRWPKIAGSVTGGGRLRWLAFLRGSTRR